MVTKEKVQSVCVGLVVLLFVASAFGYLLARSRTAEHRRHREQLQVSFLVRTLTAALLAMSPVSRHTLSSDP
jgi:hypothetical protein